MKTVIFFVFLGVLLQGGIVSGQDRFYLMPEIMGYESTLSIANNGESLFFGSSFALRRFDKIKNDWVAFYGNSGYVYQNPGVPNDSLGFRQDKFKKIFFANKQLGFALSSYGRIYKTIDGGVTWVLKTAWSPDHEFASIFLLDSVGYAVGYKLDSRMWTDQIGVIYKTIDSGDTWVILKTLEGKPLRDVIMVNHDTIYAIGDQYYTGPSPDGLILRSSDGGKNWNSRPITSGGSRNPYPQKIIKYHNNEINVLFRVGGDYSYLMTIYYDGNASGHSEWELFAEFLTDAIEVNGTRYVVGYSGTIYKSTQFGVWTKQDSPSRVNLKAVTMIGNDCYILGGYDPLLNCFLVIKAENVVSSSAVSDLENDNGLNDLNLYPNPTSGLVKYKQGSLKPIQLYNSNGYLLEIFKPLTLEGEMNLSSYPSGIYFLNKHKIIKN